MHAPEPVVLDKVPQAAQKLIQKATCRSEETMLKGFKAEAPADKTKKDLEILAEGTSRFPAGMRPFMSRAAAAEFDDTLRDAEHRDLHWATCIPTGTSMRDALQILHHSAAAFRPAVELEAMESNVLYLKPYAIAVVQCRESGVLPAS